MGIQRLDYTSIPKDIRVKKAKEIQSQLRSIMSDPSTSTEQRVFANRQMKVLKHWVNGTLPTEPEGAPDYQALAETVEKPPV